MPLFSSILGAVAPTLVGSLLGGGKSSKGPTTTKTATPMGITGGGMFDTTARGGITLDPRLQQIQQQLYGQAGAGGAFSRQAGQLGRGFLDQVGAFDPFEAAETQFGRMEEILAPQREQQRQAAEERLFAQGRLGSTGGALQQQALEDVFAQQQQRGLFEALGQAQDIQKQQAALGTMFGQIPQQQQQQALQDLLRIQTGGMGQLTTGGQLGGTTSATATPGVPLGQTIGTGLMTGGAEMLQRGIQDYDWGGGLFGSRDPYANTEFGMGNWELT